jgi:predicted nucleic acid-binding protein
MILFGIAIVRNERLMPQALLIDSDILTDHLRKEQSALDYIRQKIDDGSDLFISVISRTEILCGARKGEDETIRSLFDILTTVDVDLAIADGAGEYLRKLSLPQQRLQTSDQNRSDESKLLNRSDPD